MVYRKRRPSRALEQAQIRAAGLTAINPNMDFGDNRSLQDLNDKIEQLHSKLNAYNTALTTVDTLSSEIKEQEKSLNDLSEKLLIGVAFQYGKDSNEYQMAGGVRKSDRIRRSSAARIKADDEATPKAS